MAAPQEAPRLTLRQLLRLMVEPPQLRIDGALVPLRTPPLKPRESKTLCYEVMTEDQRLRFEKGHEIDFSFGVKSLSRFRSNVFLQRGAVAGAFRAIPFEIRPLSDLGQIDHPRVDDRQDQL